MQRHQSGETPLPQRVQAPVALLFFGRVAGPSVQLAQAAQEGRGGRFRAASFSKHSAALKTKLSGTTTTTGTIMFQKGG